MSASVGPAGTSGPTRKEEISVIEAEREFNELAGELKRISSNRVGADPENHPGEDFFDLREYLTSTNDANANAGIKHKRVGVTWENLTVRVAGGVYFKIYVRTFGAAMRDFCLLPITFPLQLFRTVVPSKNVESRAILDDFRGSLRPGEMCLVLGRPGSGCSTFLKAITNNRKDYFSVTGDVLYAGIEHEEMATLYPGEVVYNQEDDVHLPSLTVAQTVDFALSTKTPKKRLPGISPKTFVKNLRDTLLKMVNMSHTTNTLVGNAFIRGVSGGERKRVSILETLATRAVCCAWDNSTRGLDASTALDFAKSLRIMTDLLGHTTFVSLYQAGEGIYQQFDKVLVIDSGRQVYFGPASEARQYFVDLGFENRPRQTTADFLTGCTDPNERKPAAGRDPSSVPSSPEALEEAFRSSKQYLAVESELAEYKKQMALDKSEQEQFRAVVAADKRRGVSRTSPYTISYFEQIRILTARQFRLQLQDTFTLVTSNALAIILACVIGAAFINLPTTSSGAFTRTGVVFLALVVNIFDSFGEIVTALVGRPVLYKQVGYKFFSPSATAIASTLADIPFSAVRVFMFNIIVYFMAGLVRTAGNFWTFHVFIYMSFLAMQGFFRTFGLLCASFESAFRLAVLFLPNMITYSGYIIPVFDQPRWLFWIYYINPLNYAFAGIITNEFRDLNFSCDGASVVPRNIPGGTTYPDQAGPNQACTLFGQVAGQTLVKGSDYIRTAFAINIDDIWRLDFVVIIVFFIFFLAAQVALLEYHRHDTGMGALTIYAEEDAERAARNRALEERKANKGDDEKTINPTDSSAASKEIGSGKPFTWEELNYVVPVPGGERRLLNNVDGYIKPGTLTALMGASGAGKTTCLDVLAQRKNIGTVSGTLLVGGRPVDSSFARGTAYAEQQDVHEGTATVREAMRFSASLRQDYQIPEEEKYQYVEDMIELLELQPLADAMVFSLGVEARKRLTIGVELASRPKLALFLDEPTSGLDGQSAWNLIRFLKKLADAGQTILCTIHQPSAMLFESFDRLLLLQSGGETVYFGEISKIEDYFARYGAILPPTANMAEFMLDAIGAGLAPRIGNKDWGQIWNESPEAQTAKEEIKTLKSDALDRAGSDVQVQESKYASPFFHQLKTVTRRSLTMLWRNPDYVFTRLFVHIFIAFFTSMTLIQLGYSIRDLQYRVFGIFWVTAFPIIVMSQLAPIFIMNRMIFIREASSGIYSPEVFAIAQLISEVPYSILCATVYWALDILPMGFGKGSEGSNGLGYQYLMILFVELFGVSLGQAVGAISPTIRITALFSPFLAITLSIFAGVNIPYPQIPYAFRWLYQLTPYTRVVSGMLSTELHGLPIRCRDDEFAIFNPPAGQTCLAWAGQFVRNYGGYLADPAATQNCRYCQFANGDEYFVPLAMSFETRWRDLFILFAYFIFNIIFTIVASRFLRFAKR